MEKTLTIALKEWAIVCNALEAGRQIILLRKGGIYEAAGEFELEHPQFLLFPTYLHQKLAMLKPEAHAGFVPAVTEPSQITLSAMGSVTDIIQLRERRQMESIDDEHIWTPALIDMRFNYKPQNPLYLLLVRVYRLPQSVTIANTPAYAGCKSWVPLHELIETQGSLPSLHDSEYDSKRTRILKAIAA